MTLIKKFWEANELAVISRSYCAFNSLDLVFLL